MQLESARSGDSITAWDLHLGAEGWRERATGRHSGLLRRQGRTGVRGSGRTYSSSNQSSGAGCSARMLSFIPAHTGGHHSREHHAPRTGTRASGRSRGMSACRGQGRAVVRRSSAPRGQTVQVFYCVKLYSKSAPSNSIFEAGQVQGKVRPQSPTAKPHGKAPRQSPTRLLDKSSRTGNL